MGTLSNKQRAELKAAGHRLRAKVMVRATEAATPGSATLEPGLIEHVRRAMRHEPLIKVRVQTDDREACARLVRELAERVGCELVQQIGRVALLYRPVPTQTTGAEQSGANR